MVFLLAVLRKILSLDFLKTEDDRFQCILQFRDFHYKYISLVQIPLPNPNFHKNIQNQCVH